MVAQVKVRAKSASPPRTRDYVMVFALVALAAILLLTGFAAGSETRGAAATLGRNCTSDAGSFFPAWSPDGKWIAFVRGCQVWLMRPDGSGQRPLTSSSSQYKGGPAWSPDGRTIAFVASKPIPGDRLYLVNADGSHERRLTNLVRPENEDAPSWSPNGRKLLTTSGNTLVIIGLDGRVQARLPHWEGRGGQTWSPDGRRIAFWQTISFPDQADTEAVMIMNTDWSGKRRLTGPDDWAVDPAWSPDGREIAYPNSHSGADAAIWVTDTDGHHQRKLWRTASDGTDFPTWSPDGRKIAFEGDLQTANEEIYVVNANGTNVRRLTNR
jgi:TolB protein